MKNKKVVVTGGAGFIGSNVVDAFTEKGCEVLVIDDFSSGSEENLTEAMKIANDSLKIEKVDICSSAASEAIKSFSPDVIVHHAAQMNVRHSVTDPIFDADKNIIGTINLLQAATECGCHEFIFASTGGAIYGEQETFPADESHPISPESPYGLSKRCAEMYLDYYSRKHNIGVVVLRYGNVYGPRQNPKGEAGVVAIFTQNIIAGKGIRINGDGKQTRDYVYIADVVEANILASSNIPAGSFNVYNVGLGIESSVIDIVEALKVSWSEISQELGRDNSIEVTYGPTLAGEQRRSVVSPQKIRQTLNWSGGIQLAEGIDMTVRSYL